MKQAGRALSDLTKTAAENWTRSCVITGHLVAALRGQKEFRVAYHSTCLREGSTALGKRSVLLAEEDLAETLAGCVVQGAHQLQRAPNTGAWLTVQPSTINGTELGAQEWRDALFLRYGLDPLELPHHCNGCNATFSICHVLDCKWGVLDTARHNEIRDGVVDLSGEAFTPSHVRDNPLIFVGS